MFLSSTAVPLPVTGRATVSPTGQRGLEGIQRTDDVKDPQACQRKERSSDAALIGQVYILGVISRHCAKCR